MTLVDKHLLTAALAERDAAREENARLRAAVEEVLDRDEAWHSVSPGTIYRCWRDIRKALAVPTADDGAERGAR